MANKQYFQDAINRHGFAGKGDGGNADFLMADFKKKTQGLDQDLAMEAMQGGRMFGASDKKRYDELVRKRAEAKSRAQQAKGNNSNNNNQTATNTGDIAQKTDIKNTQEQNVNQDNDITTTINGDNNRVFNEQDNSIRQYGGDNRSLVINEANTGNQKGSGGYYNSADKAITMGTLGGFYAPDDSPAGQAKFVDQAQTMNRDAQKRYSNVGVTTAAKYSGQGAGKVDIKALQRRIDGNEQYFRDRATVQETKTYGDRAAKFRYDPFEFGDPIEEVKSNAGDIASGYRDDIDNL